MAESHEDSETSSKLAALTIGRADSDAAAKDSDSADATPDGHSADRIADLLSPSSSDAPASPSPSAFSSTSLYVGNLADTVTEAQLFELFSQAGQVASIRVCRDAITRRSLGYAYVNYGTVADASRALDLLNFTDVAGRPLRVMYSQRDPSRRRSGTANIFIKNLDKSVDHRALHDTFAAFGAILSCKVATDEAGQSKGFAFVQFEAEEAARTAIEKVNGMLLAGKQVFVGPFVRRQERGQEAPSTTSASGSAEEGPAFTNLYVKGLSEKVSDERLRQEFERFGAVVSAVVMREPDGRSRGFGFVNFEKAEDAAKAVEGLNGAEVEREEGPAGKEGSGAEKGGGSAGQEEEGAGGEQEAEGEQATEGEADRKSGAQAEGDDEKEPAAEAEGAGDAQSKAREGRGGGRRRGGQGARGGRKWFVGRAQRKAEREAELRAAFDAKKRQQMERAAGSNLYVKNIDEGVNEAKLREVFSECGKVTSCKILKDNYGKNKGVGFVMMSSPEEAAKAIADLSGRTVGGRALHVAVAQPREQRHPRGAPPGSSPFFLPGAGPGSLFLGPAAGLPTGANAGAGPLLGAVPGQMFAPPGVLGQPALLAFQQQQQLLAAAMQRPGMLLNAGGAPLFLPPGQQLPLPTPPGGARGPLLPAGPRGFPYGAHPGGAARGSGPLPLGPPAAPPARHGGGAAGAAAAGTGRGPGAGDLQGDAAAAAAAGAHAGAHAGGAGGEAAEPGFLPGGPPSIQALASLLTTATPEQLLGEQLYPLVAQLAPEHAAKVTGMLLEMDRAEVLLLLESPEALQAKVAEALAVLRMAGGGGVVGGQ